jgi:hypothetical protein
MRLVRQPGADSLLFANEAFYQAFADGDYRAMEGLWASEGPVSCVHPGWPPLHTRAAILESWRQILAAGPRAGLGFDAPHTFALGELAWVVCREHIEDAVLVATNVFHRVQRHWLLVHHQAGPLLQS